MKSLKHWSILRLVVVLGIVGTVVIAVVGTTSYLAMHTVKTGVDRSNTASDVLADHSEVDVTADAVRADTYATLVRSAALAGASKDVQTDIADVRTGVAKYRAVVESGTFGAEARRAYQAMVKEFEAYAGTATKVAAAASSGNPAATALIPQFVKQYEQVDASITRLIDILNHVSATSSTKAGTDARNSESRTLMFLIAGVAVVGALSLFVAQRVRRMLKEKAEAETGMARIQAMVEHMPINVMYADRDFVIQYLNSTALETFETLQAFLPVPVNEIVGHSVDVFHRKPERQQAILGDPANLPHHAEFSIGPETMSLEANAIFDQHGEFIGTMATWELVTEKRALERHEREQAESMRRVFEEVTANASALSSSSAELSAISETMNAGAGHAASEAQVVSAASEQVSTSAGTVAAGIEEMQASIIEIARGAQDAHNTATQAVAVARETEETIAKLGRSSAEIGEVVDVISSIADDTNVLALNATIEAARAGEAGKGFAVVANEVKDLANETAKATDDIKHKIERIQADADASVAAIARIAEVVDAINSTQETIAASVEEQTATTAEIARNVAEVAQSSGEIAASIQGVATAAQETSTGASETRTAADELSRLAAQLQSVVDSGQRVA